MKNTKNAMSCKKNLKLLVEDYLERDYEAMKTDYDCHRIKSLSAFRNIFNLLYDQTDDIVADDLTDDQLRNAILEWYPLLTPVWNKIKSAFIDYRENILPEREKHQKMIAEVNNPSSSLAPFKEIVNNGDDPSLLNEKTYAIKLRPAPITINLSLASDKFSISMGGIRVIDRFLLQIKNAPTDIFSICNHCGKIIIITRKGKRYHTGCASKAKQKELWTKDPNGCREKERNRYRQRVRGR